jgi:hypothetical protein
MNKLGLLLVCALSFGCATQRYGYRPTGPVATAEAGFPASHYAVPPESPRGEVYVTSFGTRDIGTGGDGNGPVVHVRLAVANHSGDSAWALDPGQQTLTLSGAAPRRPDFMEIDGARDGNTTIGRGQRRVFDLYYRMPPGADGAGGVPAFDLQWQIDAGGKTVAERTSFVREPYDDYGEGTRTQVAVGVVAPWWAFGYGPGWWGWGLYGPWGYPYPYYRYGPSIGIGFGYGHGYRGYRPSYGGPRYGGGGGYGGGGRGSIRGPSVRGRPGR